MPTILRQLPLDLLRNLTRHLISRSSVGGDLPKTELSDHLARDIGIDPANLKPALRRDIRHPML